MRNDDAGSYSSVDVRVALMAPIGASRGTHPRGDPVRWRCFYRNARNVYFFRLLRVVFHNTTTRSDNDRDITVSHLRYTSFVFTPNSQQLTQTLQFI